MDVTTDQLSQYGPIGLLVAAAIVVVRAYLASGSSSIWSYVINSFLKSPPTRAEAYALHGATGVGVFEPALRLLKIAESVLLKVQATIPAQPAAPPAAPEVPKEVPK